MDDTTVKKIDTRHSPRGDQGQLYLASGKRVSMRLWQDEPTRTPPIRSRRDYETVGFVIGPSRRRDRTPMFSVCGGMRSAGGSPSISQTVPRSKSRPHRSDASGGARWVR